MRYVTEFEGAMVGFTKVDGRTELCTAKRGDYANNIELNLEAFQLRLMRELILELADRRRSERREGVEIRLTNEDPPPGDWYARRLGAKIARVIRPVSEVSGRSDE